MPRGSCLCGGIVFEVTGDVPGVGQGLCLLTDHILVAT